MGDDLTGTIFDAATGKPLGIPKDMTLSFDKLTVNDATPRETVRELNMTYTERVGNVEKSLKVGTFATFGELRKLVKVMMR